MQNFNYSDSEMEEIARDLIRSEENPLTWGENEWKGKLDPLSIWSWAEAQGRLDILADIADSVAVQIAVNSQHNPNDGNREIWASKFSYMAIDAKKEGDLEKYAKLLEANLSLDTTSDRTVEEVISIYRDLMVPEKVAYYLSKRATLLFGLKKMGEIDVSERKIWEQLIEAYKISKEISFQKGICMALLGLGEFLADEKKDDLACQFLYQSYQYGRSAPTRFAMSAKENLSQIRDRSNISRDTYQKDIDSDLLIDEFYRVVAN